VRGRDRIWFLASKGEVMELLREELHKPDESDEYVALTQSTRDGQDVAAAAFEAILVG
jgi:hypothetical protein